MLILQRPRRGLVFVGAESLAALRGLPRPGRGEGLVKVALGTIATAVFVQWGVLFCLGVENQEAWLQAVSLGGLCASALTIRALARL